MPQQAPHAPAPDELKAADLTAQRQAGDRSNNAISRPVVVTGVHEPSDVGYLVAEVSPATHDGARVPVASGDSRGLGDGVHAPPSSSHSNSPRHPYTQGTPTKVSAVAQLEADGSSSEGIDATTASEVSTTITGRVGAGGGSLANHNRGDVGNASTTIKPLLTPMPMPAVGSLPGDSEAGKSMVFVDVDAVESQIGEGEHFSPSVSTPEGETGFGTMMISPLERSSAVSVGYDGDQNRNRALDIGDNDEQDTPSFAFPADSGKVSPSVLSSMMPSPGVPFAVRVAAEDHASSDKPVSRGSAPLVNILNGSTDGLAIGSDNAGGDATERQVVEDYEPCSSEAFEPGSATATGSNDDGRGGGEGVISGVQRAAVGVSNAGRQANNKAGSKSSSPNTANDQPGKGVDRGGQGVSDSSRNADAPRTPLLTSDSSRTNRHSGAGASVAKAEEDCTIDSHTEMKAAGRENTGDDVGDDGDTYIYRASARSGSSSQHRNADGHGIGGLVIPAGTPNAADTDHTRALEGQQPTVTAFYGGKTPEAKQGAATTAPEVSISPFDPGDTSSSLTMEINVILDHETDGGASGASITHAEHSAPAIFALAQSTTVGNLSETAVGSNTSGLSGSRGSTSKRARPPGASNLKQSTWSNVVDATEIVSSAEAPTGDIAGTAVSNPSNHSKPLASSLIAGRGKSAGIETRYNVSNSGQGSPILEGGPSHAKVISSVSALAGMVTNERVVEITANSRSPTRAPTPAAPSRGKAAATTMTTSSSSLLQVRQHRVAFIDKRLALTNNVHLKRNVVVVAPNEGHRTRYMTLERAWTGTVESFRKSSYAAPMHAHVFVPIMQITVHAHSTPRQCKSIDSISTLFRFFMASVSQDREMADVGGDNMRGEGDSQCETRQGEEPTNQDQPGRVGNNLTVSRKRERRSVPPRADGMSAESVSSESPSTAVDRSLEALSEIPSTVGLKGLRDTISAWLDSDVVRPAIEAQAMALGGATKDSARNPGRREDQHPDNMLSGTSAVSPAGQSTSLIPLTAGRRSDIDDKGDNIESTSDEVVTAGDACPYHPARVFHLLWQRDRCLALYNRPARGAGEWEGLGGQTLTPPYF